MSSEAEAVLDALAFDAEEDAAARSAWEEQCIWEDEQRELERRADEERYERECRYRY